MLDKIAVSVDVNERKLLDNFQELIMSFFITVTFCVYIFMCISYLAFRKIYAVH